MADLVDQGPGVCADFVCVEDEMVAGGQNEGCKDKKF